MILVCIKNLLILSMAHSRVTFLLIYDIMYISALACKGEFVCFIECEKHMI